MTDRQSIVLTNPQQAATAIRPLWDWVTSMLVAGHRLVLEVRQETRSDAQNRRMWSILRDVSEQVEWYGQKLTDEEWKDVFSAALKKQRVVPGIDGGFVVCGQRTSKMTKREHSELTELAMAFGDERAVRWSQTSLGRDWPMEG